MKNKTKLEDLSIEQLSKKHDKLTLVSAILALTGVGAMLAGGIGLIALTGKALFVFIGYLVGIPFFAGSMKCFGLSDECDKLIKDKANKNSLKEIFKYNETHKEKETEKEKDNVTKMIEYFKTHKSVKFEVGNTVEPQQKTAKSTETEVEKE